MTTGNDPLEEALKKLHPGDLVKVEWLDASRGKIETSEKYTEAGAEGAEIDLPVNSFGVFIGIFGRKKRHIVLVASQWIYCRGLGQIDCTVIPLGTVEKIVLMQGGVMDGKDVRACQTAFIHSRTVRLTERIVVKK